METNNNNMITTTSLLDAAKTWQRPKQCKKGRKSVFDGHTQTIRYLRSSRHFSYKEVHKFFLDQGFKVTYQTLLNYIKTNKIGK